MLGHIELPALPVEVVYPHLTGLHCNTRAADRSQFFSRAIAFLNLLDYQLHPNTSHIHPYMCG
ncbi:hypothetical protein KSY82_05845, partial [Collinsella aerofaciens]|nr:hypothetical protein [Collinsella aerofaciens]